ncbi:MAG: ferric reductase-like transmembrane domain-containing protein [Candidatus Falkowbacteria bacterium]
MSKAIKVLITCGLFILALFIFFWAESGSSSTLANIWPWYFTRASGLVAYLLLFLLLVSGAGIKTSQSFKFLSPTFAWLQHRYLGMALSFAVIIHLISLLADTYLKFTIVEVLIPFASTYKPLFLSLGIIGFYIFLAVILSSIFTITKFPKAWRLLHYLPYPMFVAIFVHGYFIGTDTAAPQIRGMYLITGLIAGALSLYRLYFFYKQK